MDLPLFKMNGTSFLGLFVFANMQLKRFCKEMVFHLS